MNSALAAPPPSRNPRASIPESRMDVLHIPESFPVGVVRCSGQREERECIRLVIRLSMRTDAHPRRRGRPMVRAAHDRVKLLHGPYKAPRLRRGDRAFCLFRDCDVIVAGWTDARISCPRCRPLDVPRSHPSLLVDEELVRAIRRESAAAIRFRWGVSEGVVHRWRRALGVTRTNNGTAYARG